MLSGARLLPRNAAREPLVVTQTGKPLVEPGENCPVTKLQAYLATPVGKLRGRDMISVGTIARDWPTHWSGGEVGAARKTA